VGARRGVIGRVTDTGRWVVRATPGYDPLADAPIPRDAQIVCDLPVDFLTDAAPKYDRPQREDAALPARRAFDPATIAEPSSWSEALSSMVGSPNLGSRRWIIRQYDNIVRGGTRLRPGGSDAAVVRVPTDCLNFGNPERPEVMRQFSDAVDGLAEACRALDVPIVSGNVSLYNETDGRAILPTPSVAAVGLVADPGDVIPGTFSAKRGRRSCCSARPLPEASEARSGSSATQARCRARRRSSTSGSR
jgi:phosphoribosylformylglycinamidine (FGAM) synthase-like enzyme